MNKVTKISRSTRTRRMKRAVQEIIDKHRARAFDEAFAVMAQASPHGSSTWAVRYFDAAWLKTLQPPRS